MPETFQLIGQIGSSGRKAVARLRWNFGDGYEMGAVVGHQDGQEFVSILFNALSDRAAQNITDPEDMASKTPMEYALDFFLRREQDGEAFNVTTTRGATLLVYLDEDEISWDVISKNAHKTGLKFRQARTS
jgi:hypothetical protein